MSSTALGAEKAKEIIFISEAHEKFYYEKLKEVRYQDEYHKALVYCLGISDSTRRNIALNQSSKHITHNRPKFSSIQFVFVCVVNLSLADLTFSHAVK